MPHGSATTLAVDEHEKTQTPLNNSGVKSTDEVDDISDNKNKKEDTIPMQTESTVIKEHVDNEITNNNVDDTLNNKVNGNIKDTESVVQNHIQSKNDSNDGNTPSISEISSPGDSHTVSTCEISSPDDRGFQSDQGCNLSSSKDPDTKKTEKDRNKVRSPDEASSSTELGPSTSKASEISSTTSNINVTCKKAHGKKTFRKSNVKSRNQVGFHRQSSGSSRMLSRYFADDLELPVGDLAPWDDEGIETDPETIDKHPYKNVLDSLRMPEHLKQYEYFKVIPWFKMPCIIVATQTFFLKVLEDLSRQKIIGVTIKVNSASYYSTRICLMQISTRTRNYLIDAIELNASLPLLNNVFVNPEIVKVIYGSKNFFKSFQVGHNLWFVNVFDIRLAMGRLGWKNMSFRQLAEINFHVEWFEGNMLQWQKRPLQKEYRVNATISVHYLLPVYLLLKNELSRTIENKKLLGLIFSDSNEQCSVVFKQRNIESLFPELRYLEPSRAYVVHELDRWRQYKGRRKNKNVNHLLSLKDFKELIKNMPTDKDEIIRITNSEFVKKHIDEVQTIMLEASNVIGPVCSMFEDVQPAADTKQVDENVKLLESLKAAENVKPLENKRHRRSGKNVKISKNVKVFETIQENVESVGKVNLLDNVKVVETKGNANSLERVKSLKNENVKSVKNVKSIENVREDVKSVKNMNVSGNMDSRNGVDKKRFGNRVSFTQNNIQEKLTVNNSHANNIEKLQNLTLIDRAAKKTNKNSGVQNRSSDNGIKNYTHENVCNQKSRDTGYVHRNTRNQRNEAKNYISENSVNQKNRVTSHINENINKRNITKSVMQNNTSDHMKEVKTNTNRNIDNQNKERKISAHENINNQNKNTRNLNNKIRMSEKTQNKYRNTDEIVPNTNTDMKRPVTSGPYSVESAASCQVYNAISKRPITDRNSNQNRFHPHFWGHPNGEVQNWCPPVMLYQPYYDYPETYMSMAPVNMGYVHESGYSNQYDTDCSIQRTNYNDGQAYGYGVQYSYVPSRCLYHSGLDVRHPDRSMHKST